MSSPADGGGGGESASPVSARRYAPLYSLLAHTAPPAGAAADNRDQRVGSSQATTRGGLEPRDGISWQADANGRGSGPRVGVTLREIDDGVDTETGEYVPLLFPSPSASPATAREGDNTTSQLPPHSFWEELAAASKTELCGEEDPRVFSPWERLAMGRYESVDASEPETTLFKDHLETRSREPRWMIWCFVLGLGLATSVVAVLVVGLLHVFQRARWEVLAFGLRGFELGDGPVNPWEDGSETDSFRGASTAAAAARDVFHTIMSGRSAPLEAVYPRHLWCGYVVFVSFSIVCALAASLVAAVAKESVGAGIPEVLAYFNGVAYAALFHTRVLAAKLLLVVLTVASGACGAGFYGPLMLTGAMLGAQMLRRRRWVRCQNVNLVDCFRNPRDERIIVMIGAAAGFAAILSVSVTGTLVAMEMVSTVFPVHFALYVFVACLLANVCVQLYSSYWEYFTPRNRHAVAAAVAGGYYNNTGVATSGTTVWGANRTMPLHEWELFSSLSLLYHSALPFGEQISMNAWQFIPSVLLGLLCGLLAAFHIQLCWLCLKIRRHIANAYHSVTKKTLMRLLLPILFTIFSVTVQFSLATVVFSGHGGSGGDEDGCVTAPTIVMATRNTTTIGYYGATSLLCRYAETQSATEDSEGSGSGSHEEEDVRRGKGTNALAALNRAQPTSGSATGQSGSPGDSHAGTDSTASAPEPSPTPDVSTQVRIHPYASLALSNADAALQLLLSVRTPDLLSAPVLAVFLGVYFPLSAMFSSVALSLDTILPSLVMGATVGRLSGLLVRRSAVTLARVVTGGGGDCAGIEAATAWADPGVFALIGAGAFVSGTSGFTFAVAALLMETTGDFHHLLPLMVAISIARKTTALVSQSMHAMYLSMRCVPILDYGSRIHRLVMFDAQHVMAPHSYEDDAGGVEEAKSRGSGVAGPRDEGGNDSVGERGAPAVEPVGQAQTAAQRHHSQQQPRSQLTGGVVSFGTVTRLREVAMALATTTHNAFPVVSLHDATYKGLVTRRQMELLLWYVSLYSNRFAGSGSARPTAHSPRAAAVPSMLPLALPRYEVLHRSLPDFLYHEGLRVDGDSWRRVLLPPGWPDEDDANVSAAPGSPFLSPGSTSQNAAAPLSGHTLDQSVDLSPYLDPSALCVHDTTTLPRVYELFTTLGLRHVVVVRGAGRENTVMGIITRKDLMADRIVQRVAAINEQRRRRCQREYERASQSAAAATRRTGAGGSELPRGSHHPSPLSSSSRCPALLLASSPAHLTDHIVLPANALRWRGSPPGATASSAADEYPCMDAAEELLASTPLHPHPVEIAVYHRRHNHHANPQT